MGKQEITLPAMGEGIIEATITKWLVEEGKYIEEDEPLVEVATDKVDSEIPSPVSGVLSRIIYQEGEIPKIGEVLAIVETEAEVQTEPEISDTARKESVVESETLSIGNDEDTSAVAKKTNASMFQNNSSEEKTSQAGSNGHEIVITPFIRFIAKNRRIDYRELLQIKGSGLGGRITKDDLNAYILAGRPFQNGIENAGSVDLALNSTSINPESEKYVPGPGEEMMEMDRTRKLIATNMVRSKRISPHVTSMVEIDITPLVLWREQNKEIFKKKFGVKLTYTPIIVMAAVKALKEFPGINISVWENYIIRKKNINIGVATALPSGNLIVPVIKEADKRNLGNIAIQLADLASRARQGKLEPAEVKGGTFTITNMGQYDNVSGTPIINQPEVAILAVGSIKKKPGVVNTGNELTIGIRDILVLSLTYDHRVVDGALGGSFVRAIGDYLEKTLPEF